MDRVFDLIATAGDAACAIDSTQKIAFWNKAAEELLGFKSSEVLGRYCFNVFGGTDGDGCSICRRKCDVILTNTDRAPISNRDFLTHTKYGQAIWLNISTLHVPSYWQRLTLLIYVMRNITRQKIIEQDLQRLFGKVLDASSANAVYNGNLPSPQSHLTVREREVLQLLAAGMSTAKLAATLFISEATVRNHIHQIISKLGVHNRLEAVVQAMRHELL